MTRKYQDEHAEAVHSAAEGLFRCGHITEKEMKEFDDMCLVKEKKQTPKQTRQTRVSAKQTQLEQIA